MADLELDELRREFLAEAEEKVCEIEKNLGGTRTAESLDRLIYLAHQLKGSGGSYGFQRISTEAADLEKCVEQVVKGEGTDLDDDIHGHVKNLRAEVVRRMRELSPA